MYIIERGNNPGVFLKCMGLRNWWEETEDKENFTFKWKPTSYKINFNALE